MRHFLMASAIGITVALASGPAQADDTSTVVKDELARLQGLWQLLTAETDGVKAPDERVSQVRVVIKSSGHSVLIGEELVAYDVPFTIDPTKTPKQTTDTIPSGPDQGKQIKGIYKLEGDILTSCVGRVGAERPTEFAAGAGSGHTLRVFRRMKPTEGAEVARRVLEFQERMKFEGSWSFVSMVMEGKDISKNLDAADRLIMKGNHFTSKTHRGTLGGTYTVDPGTKPKTIDIALTDSTGQMHTILGIYELEGDTYKICSALPGKPRPTSFETKPGSGSSVQVLNRVKP